MTSSCYAISPPTSGQFIVCVSKVDAKMIDVSSLQTAVNVEGVLMLQRHHICLPNSLSMPICKTTLYILCIPWEQCRFKTICARSVSFAIFNVYRLIANNSLINCFAKYNGVIIWKRLWHYRPFCENQLVTKSVNVFFDVKNMLNKQSISRWLGTLTFT